MQRARVSFGRERGYEASKIAIILHTRRYIFDRRSGEIKPSMAMELGVQICFGNLTLARDIKIYFYVFVYDK